VYDRTDMIRNAFQDGYTVAECAWMFYRSQRAVRAILKRQASILDTLSPDRLHDVCPRHDVPRLPDRYRVREGPRTLDEPEPAAWREERRAAVEAMEPGPQQ